MTTVSVSIPEALRKKMAKLDEVNWSAVARNSFEQKVRDIEFLKAFAMKSKMTEKDAKQMGDKINKEVSRRFTELYHRRQRADGDVNKTRKTL